jgi:hypothetical protein
MNNSQGRFFTGIKSQICTDSGRFLLSFAAECLTEPRGGSDLCCETTKAEDRDKLYLPSQGVRQVINPFEGVSFQVAEAVMLPDMACATVRWMRRRRQGIKKFTATKTCGKK